MKRETIFSPCRKYRYTLWREWGTSELFDGANEGERGSRLGEYVQFIGLNPSTADETNDDPTVRRCIQYAKDWGFGAMCMTNIFAWRDTDPEKMKLERNPVGEWKTDDEIGARWQENDCWISTIAASAGLVVAAWGTHGAHRGRGEQVRQTIPNLHCLGTNSDGTPKHPLYLPKTAVPVEYRLSLSTTERG